MVTPVLMITSLLMPEPGLLEGKQSFFFVCVPVMFCKSNLIASFFLICFENNIFGSSVYGPLNIQTIVMTRCFLGFLIKVMVACLPS